MHVKRCLDQHAHARRFAMRKKYRSSSIAAVLLPLAALFTLAGAGPPSIRWDRTIEVARGGGEKGPWRQNDSRYDYVDDASVAIGPNGEFDVVWVDQGRKDVLFQAIRENGLPKAAPVDLSRNRATFSWLPRIVTMPGAPDRIFVLWQEIIFSGGSHGGEILFSRSEDGGASFSEPINLSNSRGGDGKGRLDRETWSNGSLDLAAAPDGTLFAAWTEYDGMLWLARSVNGGMSFSRPRQVAGEPGLPARAPSLATGPGRTVYLAWTVGEDPHADIHVAQSDDAGLSFHRPWLVGAGPGHADAPRLAVDQRGVLHLVYAESANGTRGPYRIRYTRSSGGAAKFEVPITLPVLPHHDDAGAAYPELALDAQGRLYVTWEVFPDPAGRARGLGITFSADNGNSFAPPMLVPGSRDAGGGTNGSHQGLLGKKLAVSPSGRIAVANSSLKQDERSRVWLMRGQIVR
ncbi:MAG: sialidase family protein [Massilia sp.]